MKRRQFITNTCLGASTALSLNACSSKTQSPTTSSQTTNLSSPSIRWRMATSWPKSLQILFETANIFCQEVNKMTNGNFVITPYSEGELTNGLEVLSAVQDGTVECGHTASYYYLDRSIALAFGTTLPFGFTADQQNAWLYYGGGLETMRKLYAEFGIINFPGGNSGTQMGGWFKRKVNTIDDFKGLKIRVPGLGGKILERLGAEIKVLSGEQIFTALETGAVDAAEWKNPDADQTLGLNKVAPYYYYPGWWEPGTNYEFQVNLEAWNELPQEYQEIFSAAANYAGLKMLTKFNSANGGVLQNLVLSGTKLLPFNKEILNISYQTAFAMYEEIALQDQTFREIYENWKQFKEQIYLWNQFNEISFANYTMRHN